MVGQDAERVDIGRRADVLAVHLLRRHILRRAEAGARAGELGAVERAGDADWAVHAIAARSPAATELKRLAPEEISVSLFTAAEIYEGAFNSSNPQARLALYREFLRPYDSLNFTEPIALRFAQLRAFLRRRGQMIPDLDGVIAATALEYDLTVLTFNVRHLGRIPELRIYRASYATAEGE